MGSRAAIVSRARSSAASSEVATFSGTSNSWSMPAAIRSWLRWTSTALSSPLSANSLCSGDFSAAAARGSDGIPSVSGSLASRSDWMAMYRSASSGSTS